jgi:hypothetical protein
MWPASGRGARRSPRRGPGGRRRPWGCGAAARGRRADSLGGGAVYVPERRGERRARPDAPSVSCPPRALSTGQLPALDGCCGQHQGPAASPFTCTFAVSSGGGDGIRTHDFFDPTEALPQLRHGSDEGICASRRILRGGSEGHRKLGGRNRDFAWPRGSRGRRRLRRHPIRRPIEGGCLKERNGSGGDAPADLTRPDAVAMPQRSATAALSRWRHGFEPRWGCSPSSPR